MKAVEWFLSGHHFYMNLCLSVRLSVPKNVRFSVPPLCVSPSPPLCVSPSPPPLFLSHFLELVWTWMVTITFTKQERKALRKGSTLLFVSMPPPGTPGLWVGLGCPLTATVLWFFLQLKYLKCEMKIWLFDLRSWSPPFWLFPLFGTFFSGGFPYLV